jgi:hypothetical protein
MGTFRTDRIDGSVLSEQADRRLSHIDGRTRGSLDSQSAGTESRLEQVAIAGLRLLLALYLLPIVVVLVVLTLAVELSWRCAAMLEQGLNPGGLPAPGAPSPLVRGRSYLDN